MTEVLHSSPSPSSSSSSSSLPTPTHNETLFQTQSLLVEEEEEEEELGGISRVCTTNDCDDDEVKERDKDRRDQLSLLALLVTLFRKSFWVACKTDREELCGMEIGWPTDVQHVAHVTFDRFNGFLGLPVEFEPEVPSRAPSASTTVFGVSTESMQLAYDHRGNSVPTILLLMQQRLYDQGGLQAEGIFRINAENGQEEYVRNQLNTGIVPQGIDVHCLAGLIKAWFREMPSGVLDLLSPEQLMQCETEEHCSELVRLLPPTESALLNWAINLMTDVVQHEHLNKMNAHNIAMVFAPNMTQMADPLNALMYAVRVMNFLKALITKTLREREDSVIEPSPLTPLDPDPSDENGHQGPLQPLLQDPVQETEKSEPSFIPKEPNSDTSNGNNTDEEFLSSTEESDEGGPTEASVMNNPKTPVETNQSSESNQSKLGQQLLVQEMGTIEKSKGLSNLSRINSRTERIEAWR